MDNVSDPSGILPSWIFTALRSLGCDNVLYPERFSIRYFLEGFEASCLKLPQEAHGLKETSWQLISGTVSEVRIIVVPYIVISVELIIIRPNFFPVQQVEPYC